ncbi:MAG TPA: hypothetical protein VHV53_09785, partial [Solirubrobacterales bacterium]|nr:hypothetical protein [Solirubrobacterales bacterium]
TAGTADRANSATTAADAQALQGKGAAQIESAAKLSCPSGTNLVAGSCFETATRPPATYLDALYACAGVGRLLPDMTQLQTYVNTEVITTTEWSGQMYFNESIFEAIAIADGLFVQLPISDTKPYRCMVPPSN